MENIVEEIWKDIPGYENMYQVSNLGNVKSLSRIVKHSRGGDKVIKERILKPALNVHGRLRISLSKNSSEKLFQIHQLVAMAFLNHTPCGYKLVIDHINNNPLDNRVENLQIVTQRENVSKIEGDFYSKFKGVCWHVRRKKWGSKIYVNGKQKHLGYFENEHDAHLKYQEALKNLKSC